MSSMEWIETEKLDKIEQSIHLEYNEYVTIGKGRSKKNRQERGKIAARNLN